MITDEFIRNWEIAFGGNFPNKNEGSWFSKDGYISCIFETSKLKTEGLIGVSTPDESTILMDLEPKKQEGIFNYYQQDDVFANFRKRCW